MTDAERCGCEPYEMCECFVPIDYSRPPSGYYVGQTYISVEEIDGGEQIERYDQAKADRFA